MWTQTTLGASCKMYQPKTISAKEMVVDGDYVVFGANGIIGRYNEHNHAKPQLLVTCRGATCGSVNVSEPFSWINGNAMVIQPDLSQISLKYMEYLFRGGIDLSKAITGAAQPQITRKSLEPIEFSFPPLAEQQRIVAKLDAAFAEIDTAIAAAENKLAEFDVLANTILSKELDDIDERALTHTTLGEHYDVRDGTHDSPKFLEQGYPLITSKNLKNGKLDFTNIKFISEEDYTNIIKRSSVSCGDILMAMIGTIGNPIEVKDDAKFAIKNVALFKTDNTHSPTFLRYFLSSHKVKNKMLSEAKGATQKFVGLGYLRKFPISIPKLEEQLHIVDKIDAVFDKTNIASVAVTLKIRNFESLKSALLAAELTSTSEAA